MTETPSPIQNRAVRLGQTATKQAEPAPKTPGSKVSAYTTGYSIYCECGWHDRLPQADEAMAQKAAIWHQRQEWGDEGGYCAGVEPTRPAAVVGDGDEHQADAEVPPGGERKTPPAQAEQVVLEAAETSRWSVTIQTNDGVCRVTGGPNRHGPTVVAEWQYQDADGWVFARGHAATPANPWRDTNDLDVVRGWFTTPATLNGAAAGRLPRSRGARMGAAECV